MKTFINGAQAISMGAIEAGCSFFAGYPITPATEILLHMIRELPKNGGTAVQAEDEIASMGFCIGAAMAGARAMTATSGPGISLYSENIGLAIMGEVPIVIVDVQRMGPATGGATTVAQGDVQFLRWGTSGGYPIIALAPADAADCYTLTMRAFDLAERFRVPVFLATDKETVLSMSTVEIEALKPPEVRERRLAPQDQGFTPYRTAAPDGVPAMAHIGGPHIVRFTTSTHDEHGYLTKNPAAVDALNRRLAAKIDYHCDEIALVRSDLQDGAGTLIASYGVTVLAARQACAAARRNGALVSQIELLTLWPVPEKPLKQALEGVKRVIVPELNLGQYRREIERLAGPDCEVIGVNRVDGELISPDEILREGGLL
jgi:2-oxoglutarate/2-oxoacid ferredoxin oxidoreductase subunit alpha